MKKVLILYNPFSGKGKFEKRLKYVKERLLTKFDIVDTFRSLAPKTIGTKVELVGSEYDMLVISGGDGTLNEAINGLMKIEKEKRPVISYIPCGTCNDVGNTIGMKRNVKKAINTILTGKQVSMDICKTSENYFVYASAAGNFTQTSYVANQRLKKIFGRMAYFMEGITHLSSNDTLEIDAMIDDMHISGKYYLFLCLNSRRVAGFSLYRNTKTSLDDGIVDITFLKKRKLPTNLFTLAGFFLFGDHWNWTKNIETYSASKINIKTKDMINYNVDGEFSSMKNYETIEVLNKEIKIIVSHKSKAKYFNNQV